MTISQRIFSILKEKKKKQKELSAYTGISEAAISDWKKKGTNPSSDKIFAIANFLEVSVEYLLTGEDRTTQNVSQSAITTGNHSTSTVNIGLQEAYSQQEDETVQEITRILNGLPLKERTKLLSMIYDFEEDYKKNSK